MYFLGFTLWRHNVTNKQWNHSRKHKVQFSFCTQGTCAILTINPSWNYSKKKLQNIWFAKPHTDITIATSEFCKILLEIFSYIHVDLTGLHNFTQNNESLTVYTTLILESNPTDSIENVYFDCNNNCQMKSDIKCYGEG